MGRRALGLLLALLVVGVGMGWAWAEVTSAPATSRDAAEPISGDTPSLPTTPPVEVKPDSGLPPLAEEVPLHEETVGSPDGEQVVVPVPDGWERFDTDPRRATLWTAPGTLPGSYQVAVRIIEEEATVAERVAKRKATLAADDDLDEVEILETRDDSLVTTFVNAGYRRLVVVRWLGFSGDAADVEIGAAGRTIDRDGLEALVARMADGVRPAP